MKKSYAAIRILFYTLFLLSVYALQGEILPHFPIYGYVPVLLPIAVVGTAFFEGSVRGGIFGLFAGMLCDTAFNQPTIVFTIALAIIGIVAGILTETVVVTGFPSFLACCFAAFILTSFIQMFKLLFFDGTSAVSLIITASFQTLYSMIFTLPMYYISRALGRNTQS